MDKALDEIIKTRPRNTRRRSAGTARQKLLGNPVANAPATRARKAAAVAAAATPAATPALVAERIIVSNLPLDVNEAQVKELFSTTVGPTRDVSLSYDAGGRSKGVATVTFQKKGDGTKAYNQYNNRLIDGKRPMKIEVLVDPSRTQKAGSLVQRVAPAPDVTSQAKTAAAAGGRTGNPRRRRGGKRGGGERPPKSAADLDAEMEDYTAANAPAAAAAPATATA